ncbi:MAG: Mpv17/PMP22 family protein [Bacteroidales bacterium]|nr:Mpv17/PMP22 family protein [Bacteroidales bacterium]
MKKQDLIFLLCLLLFFAPFFIFESVYVFYKNFNAEHPFLISFIKFGILSTLGEVIGLRIRKGVYSEPGFGILPRALVWGFLGVGIKIAFIIFASGAPNVLAVLGIEFPTSRPSDILNQNFFTSFSRLQLLTAFAVSITMNTFFAPVFMTIHKITDIHIIENGGTLSGFMSLVKVGKIITTMNWKVQWDFVFKKTIPLFWYPAHTITFLLPSEFRILFAAFLGIVLGVFLSIASLKSRA